MWYGWGSGGWGGWLLMTLMMLAVWAVRSFVRPAGPDRPAGPPVDALAILEERFARGEIDQEELKRQRDVLRGTRAAGGR
jgi:putative membrane protein